MGLLYPLTFTVDISVHRKNFRGQIVDKQPFRPPKAQKIPSRTKSGRDYKYPSNDVFKPLDSSLHSLFNRNITPRKYEGSGNNVYYLCISFSCRFLFSNLYQINFKIRIIESQILYNNINKLDNVV